MQSENPWAGIGAASPSRIKGRRINEKHPYDFFWACNAEGKYALVLETKEDAGEWGSPPEIRGIAINYYRDQRQLQLVLQEKADWEVFKALSLNLLEATSSCPDVPATMNTLMARLTRWQQMLSRGRRRILDEREIRGLIGELLFLKGELMARFGSKAIRFWQGPDRLPQDFVVGKYLFEIKTHLVGDAPKIYIASPEQLWSEAAPLYLSVLPLAKTGADNSNAVTLPGIITALTGELHGKPELDEFDLRLSEFGYMAMPEYEEQAYLPGRAALFEIVDGFPRILSSAISDGIRDVRYSIRLDACSAFAKEPDWTAIGGTI